MASALFAELERRLAFLEQRIPVVPATQTSLSDAEKDEVAAYALLTCAACERYVEDICKWVADEVVSDFSSTNTLRRGAKYLLLVKHLRETDLHEMSDVVFGYGFRITLEKRHVAANSQAIATSLSQGRQSFSSKLIDKNNGVSLNNIKKMLCAIGFDFSSLEPNLRSYLPTLVKLRGDAAHSVIQVQQQWHPTVLRSQHASLVQGFRDLDEKLIRFRTRMN